MYDITIRDGCVIVSGAANDESLKKLLSYWHRSSVYDYKKFRRVMRPTLEALYTTYGDTLVTDYGLLSRILKYTGSDRVKDLRVPMPKPMMDKALEGLWDIQKPIVEKALMGGGGVISAPTGLGKTVMAAAIIKAFDPEELIVRGTPTCVFTCPERDINYKNYLEFVKLFPDRQVGVCQSGVAKVMTDDIMVVTLDSLNNIDMESVGVLICDEVHEGVSDTRVRNLVKARNAIKYGVSATPSGRCDNMDMVIEAVFGPVVSETLYSDGVEAGVLVPIKVIWVDTPEPPASYYSLQKRESKILHGIVRHDKRNRLIAEIIRSIPEGTQTLGITPTIEHMSGVRKHFPDVPVCHAETNCKSLTSRGIHNIPAISTATRKDIYKGMVDGTYDKMLSTYVYKQGVNFPGLKVMINMGGGGSEIASKQIPGRASRVSSDKDIAYLIDFRHEWDREDRVGKQGPLLSNDRKRSKYYRDLGFEEVYAKDASEVVKLLND